MARSNFPMYFSWKPMLECMTAEDRGVLLLAMMEYAETGEVPDDLSITVAIGFAAMRKQIDRDAERYATKCERMRSNASKSGMKSKQIENDLPADQGATTTTTTTTTTSLPAEEEYIEPQPQEMTAKERVLSEVVKTYEDTCGNISRHAAEQLKLWIDEFGGDLVLEAIHIADESNGKSLNYIKAVLDRARMQKIDSPEALRATKPKKQTQTASRNVIPDRSTQSGDMVLSAINRPHRLKRRTHEQETGQ